jgi:hypothetical protein
MNTDLLVAIHHLCTYTEYKILFAAAYYEGTNPTFAEIQDVTGITQPNNYFRERKQLVRLGYLTVDNNSMHVNVDKILADYALLTK